MLKTVKIDFEQAKALASNSEADFFPFGKLSEAGKQKAIAFANDWYEGSYYDSQAVYAHCEKDATELLDGDSSADVEFTGYCKFFGSKKVELLYLYPEDFDWFIHGYEIPLTKVF